jgi:hypothetical protein
VLKWRNEFRPELKAEGYSRLTYELEKEGKSVKLTVIHEIEKEGSNFIEAVSSGASKVCWKPANRWKKPANGHVKRVSDQFVNQTGI